MCVPNQQMIKVNGGGLVPFSIVFLADKAIYTSSSVRMSCLCYQLV